MFARKLFLLASACGALTIQTLAQAPPDIDALLARVAERIEDPDTTSEIKEVIKDGAFYGMVTFDQWLLRLIQEGTVSVADAMQAVSSRHDFELAMQQAGIAVPV